MNSTGINRVACVIVTYNRLELLKMAIMSLRKQSYVDNNIIIVNNGSTDGTKEWLTGQTDLIVINQTNLGGAGGFYSGMKYAFENGYEWIWMMDDDGVADKYQLENLLKGAKRLNSNFVNALVCNIDNKERLAFGHDIDGHHISLAKEAKRMTEIKNSINPFNGTLVHRSVIEKIGFIKKEMFIWGDEVEYMNRAMKAGYVLYTITDAIHYHPAARSPQSYILPFIKRGIVSAPNNPERAYIKYRNIGYLCHTYFPQTKNSIIIKHLLYFMFRFNLKGYRTFLSAFRDGENGIFKTFK